MIQQNIGCEILVECFGRNKFICLWLELLISAGSTVGSSSLKS
jgi:hypothetical protein